MRILILVPTLSGGGAERSAANFANCWAARGDEVFLISMGGPGGPSHTLDPRVRVEYLDVAGNTPNIVAALLANFRRVAAIRRMLITVAPDIAMAMMESLSVQLALAGHGLRCRTIGCERIYPGLNPIGPLWQYLRRHLYGRLDAVAVQTRAAADWVHANTSARKIAVIPNPVSLPLESEDPRQNPDAIISSDRALLLAVGRLVPQKGFAGLVHAFAEAAGMAPGWDLVILGEGPSRNEIEQAIRAEGMIGRVILPGRAGNIADWYRRASLFVLSSSFEGFPNALAEAMAHGVAAVSFDCLAGPADIIRPGLDGFLVPAGDQRGLAQALARLMTDESLRHDFARRAAEVTERFSQAKILRLWDTLFEGLGAGK